MPQLFGFLLAVAGAILFMRWLSRQQAMISKTLDKAAQHRARTQGSSRKEPVEKLEQGEDGVFRPANQQSTNPDDNRRD